MQLSEVTGHIGTKLEECVSRLKKVKLTRSKILTNSIITKVKKILPRHPNKMKKIRPL